MTTTSSPAPVRANAADPATKQAWVNVLDHGAVPDGVTDCAPAFQAAVDALDANTAFGGGTVFVPAAPNIHDKDGKLVGQGRYRLDRPVIVDKNKVRILGEDEHRSVISSGSMAPAFIFGLYRGTPDKPMSPDHWVDLGGILDDSAIKDKKRWGYRTVAGGERCTISFPASPFALGPQVKPGRVAPDNWTSVSRLTLDFVVQNNDPGPWLDFQPLFGMVDFAGRPAPWYAQIRVNGSQTTVQFRFRTTDGLYRELGIPFDGTQPLLRCSLQLDLADPGHAAAWVGHTARSAALAQVPVDTSLLNDFSPGVPLKFVTNDVSPFHLGALTPLHGTSVPAGAINVPKVQQDLTFAALRLTAAPRYVVADLGQGANPPQQTLSGRVPADIDLLTPGDGSFANLPMDEAVRLDQAGGRPDYSVPYCAAPPDRGFGLLVSDALVDADKNYGANIGGNAVENLTIACDRLNIDRVTGYENVTVKAYGQGIALGLVYDFAMSDVHIIDYAHGLGSYHLGVSYPVTLRKCDFQGQAETGIYGYDWIVNADGLSFGGYGRSAITATYGNLTMRNVFVADIGTNAADALVRLYEPVSGQFDNCLFDLEAGPVRDSYFRVTLASFVGGAPHLVIRDCQGGLGEPDAVGIRLVSANVNAGIATSGRPGGWCTIERSFTNYSDPGMKALVAVDGPLWQGTFTGLPAARPDFVVTTAEPGASARIGTGSVPPAISVLAPTSGDPVPRLPGLVGYYRADGAQNPDTTDPTKRVPAADGTPFTRLADHAVPGREGTLATGTTPAIYRANAINGLPALVFSAGHYTLPSPPAPASGSATVFVVGRGQQFHQTGNLWFGGHYWAVANVGGYGTAADSAGSDTDWIVHTVRYTVRPAEAGKPPARVLQSWANGKPYDTKRFDGMQDVGWSAMSLGSSGASQFTGELTTAIFVDGALSDEQIELVNRYLLHRHQIAV